MPVADVPEPEVKLTAAQKRHKAYNDSLVITAEEQVLFNGYFEYDTTEVEVVAYLRQRFKLQELSYFHYPRTADWTRVIVLKNNTQGLAIRRCMGELLLTALQYMKYHENLGTPVRQMTYPTINHDNSNLAETGTLGLRGEIHMTCHSLGETEEERAQTRDAILKSLDIPWHLRQIRERPMLSYDELRASILNGPPPFKYVDMTFLHPTGEPIRLASVAARNNWGLNNQGWGEDALQYLSKTGVVPMKAWPE